MDWYLGGSSIKVCKLHLAVVNCRLINSTMQHHRRMRRHSWTSRSEFDGAILALAGLVGIQILKITHTLLVVLWLQPTDRSKELPCLVEHLHLE